MENRCKICNFDLDLSIDKHYVARDNNVTGLSVIARNEEVTLYDAFECPKCGCQNIMQERKRPFIPSCIIDDIDEEEEEEE